MSFFRNTAGVVLLSALAVAPAMAKGSLDEGKLDPAWFGSDVEFREVEDVDYLWVKPGFSLEGTSVQFATWQEPKFLGDSADKRDAGDKRLANDLSERMPEILSEAFRNALGEKVKVVGSGAKVRATGQIVDCSTGSAAAKFWVGMGAGSGNTTFNLKFVDAKSGELLAAIHQRVVSGTNLSTTDSKLVKWVDEFADELAKTPLEKLYQKGKKAKD